MAEEGVSMREILFRGKRLDTGEWVEGFLLKVTIDGKTAYLIFGDNFCFDGSDVKALSHALVDPATVGQFTGLVDKDDKRIFEGDLFRDESEDLTAVVIFKDGCFRLEWHGITGTWTESGFDECGGGYGITECEPVDYWYVHDMEVIGNIHDNPELLEGGQA